MSFVAVHCSHSLFIICSSVYNNNRFCCDWRITFNVRAHSKRTYCIILTLSFSHSLTHSYQYVWIELLNFPRATTNEAKKKWGYCSPLSESCASIELRATSLAFWCVKQAIKYIYVTFLRLLYFWISFPFLSWLHIVLLRCSLCSHINRNALYVYLLLLFPRTTCACHFFPFFFFLFAGSNCPLGWDKYLIKIKTKYCIVSGVEIRLLWASDDARQKLLFDCVLRACVWYAETLSTFSFRCWPSEQQQLLLFELLIRSVGELDQMRRYQ